MHVVMNWCVKCCRLVANLARFLSAPMSQWPNSLSGMWSPRQLHIPVRTGGIFYFPWHIHQIEGTDGFWYLIRKTLATRDKRNCQSSEAKFSAVGFEPSRDYPVASPSQRSNPLGYRPSLAVVKWRQHDHNINAIGFRLMHLSHIGLVNATQNDHLIIQNIARRFIWVFKPS